MSFTYQLGNNPQIDYPRLLIADTDSTHPVFQDEEILAMYNIAQPFVFISPAATVSTPQATATPRFVAAGLLECLASNKARLAAALEVLDIRLDPSKAAQELRKTAEALRDAERNDGTFAIIETVQDAFSWRQRVWKQWLRLWGG